MSCEWFYGYYYLPARPLIHHMRLRHRLIGIIGHEAIAGLQQSIVDEVSITTLIIDIVSYLRLSTNDQTSFGDRSYQTIDERRSECYAFSIAGKYCAFIGQCLDNLLAISQTLRQRNILTQECIRISTDQFRVTFTGDIANC